MPGYGQNPWAASETASSWNGRTPEWMSEDVAGAANPIMAIRQYFPLHRFEELLALSPPERGRKDKGYVKKTVHGGGVTLTPHRLGRKALAFLMKHDGSIYMKANRPGAPYRMLYGPGTLSPQGATGSGGVAGGHGLTREFNATPDYWIQRASGGRSAIGVPQNNAYTAQKEGKGPIGWLRDKFGGKNDHPAAHGYPTQPTGKVTAPGPATIQSTPDIPGASPTGVNPFATQASVFDVHHLGRSRQDLLAVQNLIRDINGPIPPGGQ